MAEEAPEHKDRGMFGLFGKKKEGEGKHSDEIGQTPARTEAAPYYPAAPQHGVEHGHGHGHEGQFTREEAEQQKHTGKIHRTHSSSSSSSSDEEKEGGKRKEGGRKKKGSKEKFPGEGKQYSGQQGKQYPGQHGGEEEKKTGMLDKIKAKLPGQHNKNDGEQ
ncbi:hypothetical protein NBB33_23690 [Salmonella sp. NW1189]